MLLISKSNIEKIKEIGRSISEERINPYIREAQDYDLKPYLTNEFYEIILEGADGNFTNISNAAFNSIWIYIERALSYFALARLIEFGEINVSSFGTVQKQVEWSARVSETAIQRIVSGERAKANAELTEMDKFIFNKDNSSDYPVYIKNKYERIKQYNINIWGIH